MRHAVGSPSLIAGKCAARMGCVRNGVIPSSSAPTLTSNSFQRRNVARAAHQRRRRPTAGRGEQAHHVVRVPEPEEIRDHDEQAVGLRPSGSSDQRTVSHEMIAMPHERDRVHLLVDDGLIPDRERGGADERRERGAREPLPPLGEPADEYALGDEEPHSGGNRAGRAPRGC